MTPLERIQARSSSLQMLRSPSALSTACSAWLHAAESSDDQVAWFLQSVLRRVLSIRGMTCFASSIPTGALKTRPPNRRRRPALVSRLVQLDLRFEDQ